MHEEIGMLLSFDPKKNNSLFCFVPYLTWQVCQQRFQFKKKNTFFNDVRFWNAFPRGFSLPTRVSAWNVVFRNAFP